MTTTEHRFVPADPHPYESKRWRCTRGCGALKRESFGVVEHSANGGRTWHRVAVPCVATTDAPQEAA